MSTIKVYSVHLKDVPEHVRRIQTTQYGKKLAPTGIWWRIVKRHGTTASIQREYGNKEIIGIEATTVVWIEK